MSSGLRKVADTAPIVNYGKLSDGLNLAPVANLLAVQATAVARYTRL